MKKNRTSQEGKNNAFYGRHHTLAWKKAERKRKRGRHNPMYGKRHRQSTIQKIKRAARRRYAK